MVSGRLPCFCSSSTTPKPSTSGIWTSRKTRSGCSRWIKAMAELPSPHSATTSRSGSSSSRLRRRSRASASSSLSNTRMDMGVSDLLILVTGAIGNADLYDASAARRIFQHHGMIFVVELLQPAASVAETDAFARRGTAAASETDSVVADFHPYIVVIAPGGNTNQSGRAAWTDAMADGVFHQRLQNQVRHERVHGGRVDGGFHLQAIAEARLLDVDVLLQEHQLLLQGNFLHAHSVERHA